MTVFEHIADCQMAQDELKGFCDEILDSYKNTEDYNNALKQIISLQSDFEKLEKEFEQFKDC